MEHYQLKQGIIYHKGRIWVGMNLEMQKQLLTALHASPLGGHSGFPVTYHKVKKLFSWPKLKTMVKSFVASCGTCQQAKVERVKYPGLLQPLKVPPGAWHTVTLDFIEGLPKSGQFDCLLVVVDKFSKYSHFLPLKHPYTAASVAQAYLDGVFKLHGMPVELVSDRDPVFTSNFWKELMRLVGVQLDMSSGQHPQSDGQTERVNQSVEGYLRCFVHDCPRKWAQWIPLAEFWYNTSKHESLGMSPFEALYNHPPRHLGIDPYEDCAIPDLREWLHERTAIQQQLRQHLLRAQQRMKSQADKNWTEREFQVGDKVYLKLQPYIQKSIATRANPKLAFKYYGPFLILRRIGAVAYELQLPEKASVHPVFHVSQLKYAIGQQVQSSELPLEPVNRVQPQQIIKRRQVTIGSSLIPQVLIRWSGMDAGLETWENEHELKAKFPDAAAWG
jgi:transposase InsO family protein